MSVEQWPQWLSSEAQRDRVVRRYRRYERIRTTASVILTLAMAVLALALAVNVNIWLGLLVFLVGTPIAGAIIGPFIMLPVGYLLCGRDAMRLGVMVQRYRDGL